MRRWSMSWVVFFGVAAGVHGQEPWTPFSEPHVRVVNSVAFSPTGDEMYLALLYPDFLRDSAAAESAPATAMFRSTRTPEGWSAPEQMDFSGVYQDYEPTVSADGRLMVFNSRRPGIDGQIPSTNDLWWSERGSDGGWSAPRRIDALSTLEQEESYATLAADGTLVYLAGRPGADGVVGFDLMVSRFEGGAFTPATVHPVSRNEWGEGDPWIAHDGSYLIFTRWDPDREWRETVDLYVSFSRDGSWSEPEPLTRLNTAGPDYGAAVSADGQWLYYRANGRFMRVELSEALEGRAYDASGQERSR
ncbi:MAG: hypothetical protein AAF389_09280 [Gemmatimonadota bacterium]